MIWQAMEYTDRCVALSEPNSLALIAKKFWELGDSLELRQLTRDIIRWECRPYPSMQPPPLGYFVKALPSCMFAIPMFR